ncbi:MAG: alpha-hydroxy acid oxidase [Lautropia sp.]
MGESSQAMRERFVALQEFVAVARESLDRRGWDYLQGGTETETAVRRNRHAIDSLALRPRVLRDVSVVDSTAEVFGRKARLPLMLAPIGGLETFDPDGALALARAAGRFGVPMMLSSVSSWSMEQVAEAGREHALSLVFQLYARDGADGVDAIVERAIALGMPAFCLTVDSSVYSRRERDIVSRFVKPWRATGEGEARAYQAALSWADVARIRGKYPIPLVLKGIGTAEDAIIAVEHGIDFVHVSNHGGRQLDHVRGSMAVLPEVVAAVAGRAKVFVDGGICRGTDIAKALALGADAVCIGRLMCAALAAAGGDGVVRMLEILEEEYRIALALLGVRSGAELDAGFVRTGEPAVQQPGVWSAFPLLAEG